MIVQLRRAPSRSLEIKAPEELLLACHGRIRSATAIANRIVTASVDDARIAEAALQVHRFYSVGVPLHAEDEDVSVRPRLINLSHDRGVEHALTKMSKEHLTIDELCGRVAGLCDTLAREPLRLQELRVELERVMSEINVLWDRHLGLEERVIFPALALLSPDDRTAIVRECRARREGNAVATALIREVTTSSS